MNPEFLQRIRQLFARSAKETAQTEQQLASSAADTLAQVSGGGRPSAMPGSAVVHAAGEPIRKLAGYASAAGIGGMYSPVGDMIVATTRPTFVHEMGHRREAKEKGLLGMLTGDNRFTLPKEAPATPAEQRARANVNPYYQTNPREGYAKAFETAYNILDLTRNDPNLSRERMAKVLAHYEARFPGTGILVKELLDEPIYREHPARQILR